MPETDLIVTAEDIQGLVNETLPTESLQKAAEAATTEVRDYCGWRVAKSASETAVVPSRGGGRIFLPSLHVTDITSIMVKGEAVDLDEVDWSAAGVIELLHGRWPRTQRGITVTFTHGYSACPGGVMKAIAAMASRGILVPAGGIASEGAIGQNVVYSRRSAGGMVAGGMFVDDELERLDQYRLAGSR